MYRSRSSRRDGAVGGSVVGDGDSVVVIQEQGAEGSCERTDSSAGLRAYLQTYIRTSGAAHRGFRTSTSFCLLCSLQYLPTPSSLLCVCVCVCTAACAPCCTLLLPPPYFMFLCMCVCNAVSSPCSTFRSPSSYGMCACVYA